MSRNLTGLSRQYEAALRKDLRLGPQAKSEPARGIGRRALTAGAETLDLVRIHERALAKLVLPGDAAATRNAMIRRAGHFFAEAITPIERRHRTALEADVQLEQINRTLRQRSADLAASRRRLKQEITQRKEVEEALRNSAHHYSHLLAQSRQMQEQLRLLSRQLLCAQEEERKRISRELHDVIAQTLTGINVQLSTLKKEAALNTKDIETNITRTQRLVEQSVNIVHRFARELRPAVLDDLGLIPALDTLIKHLREETGIRIRLTAFAAVEDVNGDKRTVLYRVAQEALTNVARHARASQAEVKIRRLDGAISIQIRDNGRGFQPDRLLQGKKQFRLGLLGMRERVEMVGGNIAVTSAPGRGTTVLAWIPLTARGESSSQKVSPRA